MTDLRIFDPSKVRAMMDAKDAEIAALRTKIKNWKDCEYESQVAALNAEIAALKARVKELEAALSGRTVSCVCGAEAQLAALLPVLEAAKGVDARCPEGFDGQDNWTNEAHRILNVALAAYAARYPDQKGVEK